MSTQFEQSYQKTLRHARKVLYSPGSPNEVNEVIDSIRELRRLNQNLPPELRVLLSLALWRKSGEFKRKFRDLNEARIQLWELEFHCPVFEFQKLLGSDIATKFPNTAGLVEHHRLLQKTPSPTMPDVIPPKKDFTVIRRAGAQNTIVCLCGLVGSVSGVGATLFDRVVAQPMNANLIVIRDKQLLYFFDGVLSLGSLDETLSKLKAILSGDGFSNTKIIFNGSSGGAAGAILYAARLNVRHVLVFAGRMIFDESFDARLPKRPRSGPLVKKFQNGDLQRPNLIQVIEKSNIERIDYFVGSASKDDMEQFQFLEKNTNVVVPCIYKGREMHAMAAPSLIDGEFVRRLRC